MIRFYLSSDNSLQNGKSVSNSGFKYTLKYPCANSFVCSDLFADLPPGIYSFSLFGASGGFQENFISSALKPDHTDCVNQSSVYLFGGNTVCNKINSASGAGGFTFGTIKLKKKTRVFVAIGGKGEYKKGAVTYDINSRAKGGYNGGGRGFCHSSGTSGGGGATDIRLINDDFWHRVLVAGGGGGSDNQAESKTFSGDDDGGAGAGGGLVAQGFWINGVYNGNFLAKQKTGFTFGNGEAAQEKGSKGNGRKTYDGTSDRSGAGGGWFGGYASHHGNGGSGGGSSFAFTSSAEIPEGNIVSYDDLYESSTTKPYAFSKERDSGYFFSDVEMAQGIWSGDGKVIMNVVHFYGSLNSCRINKSPHLLFIYISLIYS